METLAYVVAVLVLVSGIVLVHEYGHLRSARKNGIKVKDFSIGFGKTLASWQTSRKLIVNFKLIPFGGSVTPVGMTPEDVEEEKLDHEGTFAYASPFTRLRVAAAGSVYNVLLFLVMEFAVVLWLMQPSSVKEFLTVPGVMFWTTLIITGAFINLLVTAPFNGFAHINSMVNAPQGLETTVIEGQEKGLAPLLVILMALMLISLFMGVFNMLPIYPLDGFMVALAIIDIARMHSRPQAEYSPLPLSRLKLWVYGGHAFIGSVMLYVISRDVFRIFSS